MCKLALHFELLDTKKLTMYKSPNRHVDNFTGFFCHFWVAFFTLKEILTNVSKYQLDTIC